MKKLLAILLLFFNIAQAQTHTFKFILSSGPGSGSDTTIELYNPCFKRNGFATFKEFKPGAEGIVAIKYLKQQIDTDKVTYVLVGNFGMSALSKFPNINMLEDVHPITYLNQVNMAFVSKVGGASSVEDLISISKQRPINVGISTASGTFLSENLFKHLNVPYQIIPYKNNTGAVVDIMNGNLDVAVDTLISAKQLTENERVQIITSTLDRKTATKYKHRSIDRYNSQLAGIPLGIILSVNPTVSKEDKILLAKLVNMCNNDTEIIDKLERIGSAPVYLNTEEIRQLIKQTSK